MGAKIMKNIAVVLVVFVGLVLVFLLISVLNHQFRLKKESKSFTPIGQAVEVNGHRMNVYATGSGERTLVFLSGGGTCCPVLDFKSLYTLLSDRYRVVMVERAGYGFSEDIDVKRDVASVLAETRQALALAQIAPPYVLCPHSMGGIEALYWAQQYPAEISAIIGLDMAVPAAYAEMKINMPLLYLSSYAVKLGLTRFFPAVAESEALRYGTLTEGERELYRAIFYRRSATRAMLNEVKAIKASAELVAQGGKVAVPILLFVSDGSGTGYSKDKWRAFQRDFIATIPGGKWIELDCPHYIHDHEYSKISKEMLCYLQSPSQ